MFLIAVAIVVAVAAGGLAGGRLAGLAEIRPRWWGLAFAGLAMQSAPVPELPGRAGDLTAAGLVVGSYALLLAFAFLNARLAGAPLLVVGLAINLAVIAANGGMPVSEEALLASGQPQAVAVLRAHPDAKHHLMTQADLLAPLADVIPVPPPIAAVVSAGDLAIYAGAAWFVVSAMRATAAAAPAPARRRGYHGKHRPRRTRPAARPLPLAEGAWPPRAAARWGTGR
ncbi:MAG TPA: DUF5317 domain-containing protein [Actinomycetota bacterium]|nr:DUF5317 domain-containing protein [Actinomycetota bacterium]